MDNRQKTLIRQTFERVRQDTPVASKAFYDRVFEFDPSLRCLFLSDLTEQGAQLMHALGLVVANLDRLEWLYPILEELGARHTLYNVRAEHYDTVGRALLTALRDRLGDDFTPEVEEAWAALYAIIKDVMLSASKAIAT
jgi:hemoglobin-like flavoprotein